MTPQERFGRNLYFVIAATIVVEKLAEIGFALSGGFENVNWGRTVLQPVGVAAVAVYLWQGETWLKWLVGVVCVMFGVALAVVNWRLATQPPDLAPQKTNAGYMLASGYPEWLVYAIATFYLAAGIAVLFLPSLQAFFKYQRGKSETLDGGTP